MDIVDVLTQKLRELMEEHQIRAAPLARRAQLNESAVRDILRGRSKNPGIVTLQKIASVMNLRPSALFEAGVKWPVIGQIESDGRLNRDREGLEGLDAVENPFLTTLNETYFVVLARGAAMTPLAYDGDYLIVSEAKEPIDDALLGRPAICDVDELGELACIPQLGGTGGVHHLAPINAFGAGHRDVKIKRISPILCALPARFTKSHIPVTHAGSHSVHEKKSSYTGPRPQN